MDMWWKKTKQESVTAKLIVLSGPGGVGKRTVAEELLSIYPDMWQSVSATTKSPRPGEIPGTDYYFVSPADFEAKFRNGEFLEYAQVHDTWYGTLRRPVEEHLKQGQHVLLKIDVQGGLTVKRNFNDAVLIFLTPPSMDELKRRIEQRGIDSQTGMEVRMQAAQKEIDVANQHYDHVVINDDLDATVAEIQTIIDQSAANTAN